MNTRRAELAEHQACLSEIAAEKDGFSGELEELRAKRQNLRTARISSTEDLIHWQTLCKEAHDTHREMHQRLLAKGGTQYQSIRFDLEESKNQVNRRPLVGALAYKRGEARRGLQSGLIEK